MNKFTLNKNGPAKTFADLSVGSIFTVTGFPNDLYTKIRPSINPTANCICLTDGLAGLCSDKDEILAVYTKFKVME